MFFVVELWMAITRIKGRKSDENLVFEIIFKISQKLANYIIGYLKYTWFTSCSYNLNCLELLYGYHRKWTLFFINNCNAKFRMTFTFGTKLLTPLPNLWPIQHIYSCINPLVPEF